MIIFKFLKNLVLFVIKEIASLIIKLSLIAVIVVAVVLAMVQEKSKNVTKVKNNTYLILDTSLDYKEKGQFDLFNFENENINFYTLLKTLDSAKTDDRISGIILKTDDVSLNRAQVNEVSEKLAEVRKSGKKIYSFSRIMNGGSYLLSSSADEIVMPPSRGTSVNISGYHRTLMYTKKLMDRIGVKYNVIHVGDYKAYGENYVRETMSPQLRSDLTRIYDSIYNEFVANVSERRRMDSNSFNKDVLNGKYVLSNAVELKAAGLIDTLEYYEDFLGKNGIKETMSVATYSKNMPKKRHYEKSIAIIYAEGEILYQNTQSYKTVITPSVMIKELDRANDDKSVAGIVIRVDSPGGSALASEVINARIRSLDKPVYISMGGTAASGGYYISSAGDRIFADRDTVTGSIGVVSVIPNLSEIANKLNINRETISKGKLSNIYSILEPMTPEARKRIYTSSLDVYREFKDRVSKGRGIDLDSLEKIAGGRVWLGSEGLNNGLVDEIGGIEQAIESLAISLKLNNYNVIEIKEEKPFEKLLSTYAQGKYMLNKVNSYVTLDTKSIEKNELLVTPVMYLPYDI